MMPIRTAATAILIGFVVLGCQSTVLPDGTGNTAREAETPEMETVYGFADYPIYETLGEAVREADFVGVVEHISSRDELLYPIIDDCADPEVNPQVGQRIKQKELDEAANPGTLATVRVVESYKGDIEPGRLIEVWQPGGVKDGVLYLIEGSVRLTEVTNGKRIMLFARYSSYSGQFGLINQDVGLFVADSDRLEPVRSERTIVQSPFEATLDLVTQAVAGDAAARKAGKVPVEPPEKCPLLERYPWPGQAG